MPHAGGLYQIINGMNSLSVAINAAAAHTLEITAVNGTRIFHASGSGRADYTIGRKAAGVGVYIVRINADGREFTGRIIVN